MLAGHTSSSGLLLPTLSTKTLCLDRDTGPTPPPLPTLPVVKLSVFGYVLRVLLPTANVCACVHVSASQRLSPFTTRVPGIEL